MMPPYILETQYLCINISFHLISHNLLWSPINYIKST